MHRNIDHPNVLRLLDACIGPSKKLKGAQDILLLFPFYRDGTIWDAIAAAEGPVGGPSPGLPHPFPERFALQVRHGDGNDETTAQAFNQLLE